MYSISFAFFLGFWPVATFRRTEVPKSQSDGLALLTIRHQVDTPNFKSLQPPTYRTKRQTENGSYRNNTWPSIQKHLSPKWAQEHVILTEIPSVFRWETSGNRLEAMRTFDHPKRFRLEKGHSATTVGRRCVKCSLQDLDESPSADMSWIANWRKPPSCWNNHCMILKVCQGDNRRQILKF